MYVCTYVCIVYVCIVYVCVHTSGGWLMILLSPVSRTGAITFSLASLALQKSQHIVSKPLAYSGASLQGTSWDSGASLQGTSWDSGASLLGTSWDSGASLQGTSWDSGASLQGTSWDSGASLLGTSWDSGASLQGTSWGRVLCPLGRGDKSTITMGNGIDLSFVQRY